MRNSFLKFIVLGLGFFLWSGSLQAQSGKYVIGASLLLSVGDWTDVFLNGHELVDQDPNLSKQKGYVTLDLETDQLCYFQKSNVLSMEITNTIEKRNLSDKNDFIGVGYVLKLQFSDGTQWTASSSETGQHPALHITNRDNANPEGWKDPSFNDRSWDKAKGANPSMSLAVTLMDPKSGNPARYLSAFQNDESIGTHTGERWLFRKNFSLDVVPAPGCSQPRIFPTATPKGQKPPPPPPVPTKTPVPTATPRPPAPTPTPKPRPTLVPTATPRPRVIPPTATPVPVKRIQPRVPTPVPPRELILPTDTPTPRRLKAKPTPIPQAEPTATFTPEPVVVVETAPETIVFVAPPVNIFVTFGDGPGDYKLVVIDADGKPLKTLYEKHVGWSRETWVAWDGKNEQGRLMPYGQYFALFSKDGKVLRRIALTWISPDR